MEFDIKIKNFRLFNEILIKGDHKFTSQWERVRFEHKIDWKISETLLNEKERMIIFQFNVKMHPNMGEIMFEGDCILESPEQSKITFVLQNIPKAINSFIERFILKYSYINAEKFAKEQKLPFPPANFILKRFGIN